MLVNCLVYMESLVLPVAVDKRRSNKFNIEQEKYVEVKNLIFVEQPTVQR